VWVECNLLLLATSLVHVAVGVEISTLSVPVSDRDPATKCDISWNSLHTLGVQCRLELGRHESVTFARVDKAKEVDSEHGHVERDRNDDQAEHASEEVLEPQAWCHIPVVAEQDPELEKRQGADPGDGEQANPLDTHSRTEPDTSCGQPEPPRWLEGLGGSLFVLVHETCPGESGDGREDDEGRVEEDEARLGDERVVWKVSL
jgi:hypothetical protein